MTADSAQRIWSIGELLNWTANYLVKEGIESPRLDAEILLAHVLGCQKIDLYGACFADTATDSVKQSYRELIQERAKGCPTAYLVGHKDFFSLSLNVTSDVLIPRPDSEMLVTECLDIANQLESPQILDIGTGSGNLAIAVSKQTPSAQLTAVDVSPAALAVARSNAEKHEVAERIQFMEGDMFSALPDGISFDLIMCNPPYIPTGDIPKLGLGVRDFEPHIALDGGEDGFAVFERLIQQAPNYLRADGWLLIEIGAFQEMIARRRIEESGCFRLMPTVLDWSRHPRVLKAQNLAR